MFGQLRNIDSAFKHVKLFSLVIVVATAVTCCYTVFKSYEYADRVQKRTYVIVGGKAFQAVASNREDNIGVEAREHVENFHHWFFTLTPDDKAIQENIKRALYLADKSAKTQYDNLSESGFYQQMISGNISQELIKDSISVETTQAPYHFIFYGRQKIVRPTAIVMRRLITQGYLRELKIRTDQNPNAFLIEKWEIMENNDLETIKR